MHGVEWGKIRRLLQRITYHYSLEYFPAAYPKGRTSESSWRKSFELKTAPIQCLDLTPGAGNLLGQSYWEINSAWLGDAWTLNSGVSPSVARGSSLSRILEATPPSKYYLSKTACLGILRRAQVRCKELPYQLKKALEIQAGLSPTRQASLQDKTQSLSHALAAGFSAGQSTAAGGIGYQEECSPTLKASDSGSNRVPSILCLNDQGGKAMACSEDVVGTLRSQEHGHQPLLVDQSAALFENHGIDARYTGPHDVAPTMSARYGTGGNNVPLITQDEALCIIGNAIDRQPQNGGNGVGYQRGISYTLTATDRHAVFTRQRVDAFRDDFTASTQSARQHKDATDLVVDVAGLDCRNGRENGDLCGTLQPGTAGSSLNSIHPVRTGQLIRRLTPLECERLQGFPDHWTDLPGASDSARYKALGNSVAIPCVDFVLRGMVYFLQRTAAAPGH